MLVKEKGPGFDTVIAAAATANLAIPIENPLLLDGVILRGVGYTGSTTTLDLATVIDEIRVLQDNDLISTYSPALLRKWEGFLNANADTLDINSIMVPFNRFLNRFKGYGVGNIGSLVLQVKMKSTFPANTACTNINSVIAYHPIEAHVPRGDVFVNSVLYPKTPVAGLNRINDIPYYQVRRLHALMLDAAPITYVKISRGGKVIYEMTKAEALVAMQQNPLWKVPSTCTHTDISGQAVTSTGPFPVILNDFGDEKDSTPLFEGKVRQSFKWEYYWDTTVGAVADFPIFAEATLADAEEQGVNATARG